MEIFSEIYGCYYTVVAHILNQAHEHGISREHIDSIVQQHAFSESGFHLLPRLLSGEWDLLREEDTRFFSKLQNKETALPLTNLQKAWLKALLGDRRIKLFLTKERLAELNNWLSDVQPLFNTNDFFMFDAAADGDNYSNTNYIKHFQRVLQAIKQQKPLFALYESGKGRQLEVHFVPQLFLYSAKDDKFRIIGRQLKDDETKPLLLNLARVLSLENSCRTPTETIHKINRPPAHKAVVTVAIQNERNALERCMLQFAAYNKQTVFDEQSERYICDIFYNILEETEVLIRILSFGPVLEVLGPENFLEQVRERIRTQTQRMHMDYSAAGSELPED